MKQARTLGPTLVLTVLGLSACATAPAQSSSLSLPACPPAWSGATRAVLVWSDSSSQRSDAISQARLSRARTFLRTAAACGSSVSIIWSQGQTKTTLLFSGAVHTEGDTDIATARLSNQKISTQAMPAIQQAITGLTRAEAPATSSPSGTFDVAHDALAAGEGPAVVLVLDNFVAQTSQANVDTAAFTAAQARRLAANSQLPTLKGATILMEGVGVTVDPVPAPDDWVRSVRSYADALCARTKGTCLPATTQLATEG